MCHISATSGTRSQVAQLTCLTRAQRRVTRNRCPSRAGLSSRPTRCSRESAMSATDSVFAGSIPEIYDRLLVPLIFAPYAADLVGRLAAARDILELAAGTGVVTRAMASHLRGDARIVATDLNRPMLDYASRQLVGDARVTWRQADALALPFADTSFDAVL